MSSDLLEVSSVDELRTLPAYQNGAIILVFYKRHSEISTSLDEYLKVLLKQYSGLAVVKVEAEMVREMTMEYKVEEVPTFILLNQMSLFERVNGMDCPRITKAAESLHQAASKLSLSGVPTEQQELTARLEALIRSHPIMVFMKGSPSAVRCGFSQQLVAILQKLGVKFSTFDILMDPVVRQGLKDYTRWPTYPQVYVHGKFIGGLDIIKEMMEEGTLLSALKGESI